MPWPIYLERIRGMERGGEGWRGVGREGGTEQLNNRGSGGLEAEKGVNVIFFKHEKGL